MATSAPAKSALSTYAGGRQTPGHVGQCGKVRAKLYGQGNGNGLTNGGDDLQVARLHLLGRRVRIGQQQIEVQFQSVRSGLLNATRVVKPRSHRHRVEASNQGNHNGLLGLLDVSQAAFRALVVFCQFPKVGQAANKGWRHRLRQPAQLWLLMLDLFFEQGRHYGSSRTGLLEAAKYVQLTGQGAGRNNDRVFNVSPRYRVPRSRGMFIPRLLG